MIALVAAVAVAGGLRIYDPAQLVRATVTSADVSYAHADTSPQTGQALVELGLTARGVHSFCTLTRALAVRGARRHSFQHLAVAVDGHVYARPFIDYRANPRGLCGSPAFEIAVATPALAHELAAEIK
jgi:hypothetical protein